MLQTGTLYTLVNDKNSIVKKEPIENVFITFSQNEKNVLTVKTDNSGKFSFNLPVGSYQVTVSQGAGFRVFDLAGGAPFELTKDSKQNAFESWVLNPVYLRPEENPLVILMKDIAQQASDSAVKAKKAEEKAERAAEHAIGKWVLEFDNLEPKDNPLVISMQEIAQQAKDDAKKAEKAVGNATGTGRLIRESAAVKLQGALAGSNLNNILETGTYYQYLRTNATPENNYPAYANGVLQVFNLTGSWVLQIYTTWVYDLNAVYLRAIDGDDVKNWVKLYSDRNTTVDSNGFLKAASPIIRLFDDRIEHNDQFKEEPQFRKIDTGIYQVFNTLGLAKEGWTVETPKDKHGKPYFHVIVQKTYDGAIISVHDEYDVRRKKKIKDIFGEEQEVEVVEKILGEARDIKPHERWIDLRFHEEPEDIRDIDEIVELEEEQSDLEKHLEENNAVLL